MKNRYGQYICDFCFKEHKDVKYMITQFELSERYPAICNNCIANAVAFLLKEINNEDTNN